MATSEEDEKRIIGRPLLKDLAGEKQSHGYFSIATIGANKPIEDFAEIQIGNKATFVGIYDGHGGQLASRYIDEHLFDNLIGIIKESGAFSEDSLRNAIDATETGFLELVHQKFALHPEYVEAGSCLLVGVLWGRSLYIANLGDSRAVMGRFDPLTKEIVADSLTVEHNVQSADIREQVRTLVPEDPDILSLSDDGRWLIKGITEVSRVIGDAYLKQPERYFGRQLMERLACDLPLAQAVVTAVPSVHRLELKDNDRFVIFASDGLWDAISSEDAVALVAESAPKGIAKRLIQEALIMAAKKNGIGLKEFNTLKPGNARKEIHGDMTVAVLFLYADATSPSRVHSVHTNGPVDTLQPKFYTSEYSDLNILQHLGSREEVAAWTSTIPKKTELERRLSW